MDNLTRGLLINKSLKLAQDTFGTSILGKMSSSGLKTFDVVLDYSGSIDHSVPATGTIPSDMTVAFLNSISLLKNINGLNVAYWYRLGLQGNHVDLTGMSKLKRLDAHGAATGPNAVYGELIAPELEYLDLNSNGETTSSFNTGKITGDLSNNVKLTYIDLFGYIKSMTLPVFGKNPNLTYIVIGGPTTTNPSMGASLIGLRSCLKLTKFLTSAASGITTAMSNLILSELLIAKQSGGVINQIDLGSAGIPTGANSNVDAVALRNLGVTVVVRTA